MKAKKAAILSTLCSILAVAVVVVIYHLVSIGPLWVAIMLLSLICSIIFVLTLTVSYDIFSGNMEFDDVMDEIDDKMKDSKDK